MIKLIKPQGYCEGVKRAINLLDKTIQSNPIKPIYLLGKLIHNDTLMNHYKELGVIILDEHNKESELNKIESGTVIFQAHGTDDKLFSLAKDKGLNIVDATCPFVSLIHNKIKDYLNKGYEIIYIGKNNHSESMSVLSISSNIHFITKLTDVDKLDINSDLIYVSNQTTLSSLDLADILEAIKNKYPKAIIDNKICNATLKRQLAVLDTKCDLVIVVGDKNSSNSKRLYELASKNNKAIFVNDLKELKLYDIDKSLDIAITSGASTPDNLVMDIYNYLIK